MDDKIATFVSIPKCASKTILKMYNLGRNRDNDDEEKINHFIIYENHQRLAILEKKYDLTNHFIFTFVRHPYDRIKSWYYYHKSMPFYKNFSLNEWIRNGCQTHFKIQNMTNWEKEGLSPLLQYNFVNANRKVDFIGKIENFESDNIKIIKILNQIFLEKNLPKQIKYSSIKENTSTKENEEITNENKVLIYNLFKQDFDFFGYNK